MMGTSDVVQALDRVRNIWLKIHNHVVVWRVGEVSIYCQICISSAADTDFMMFTPWSQVTMWKSYWLIMQDYSNMMLFTTQTVYWWTALRGNVPTSSSTTTPLLGTTRLNSQMVYKKKLLTNGWISINNVIMHHQQGTIFCKVSAYTLSTIWW